MPRGIPNKPKEITQPIAEPNVSERVYYCYVHGEPINSIATRFKLDVQETLEMINKAEEAKG
jgi:hypothetical protein